MPDREKVKTELDAIVDECRGCDYVRFEVVVEHCTNILDLLKEQETANIYKCPNCGTWVSAENVVRCKDCIHRGNSEKCVLSAISEEKGVPLFMLDNGGAWSCADGKRR